MLLADRAAHALTNVGADDPGDHTDCHTRRVRGRMARDLAALLGVDPATVIATDDPDRTYGNYVGHLLIVTDADTTYRFIPVDVFSRDGFWLLGPCPECRENVPVAEINHIADLGRHFAAETTRGIDTSLWDSRHRPTCPYASSD